MTLMEVFRAEERRQRLGEAKHKEPKGKNPLMDLLTVGEAAQLIGLTPGAVARAIQTERLAAWKKGNVYLIPRSEVERWVPYKGRGRKKKE